MLRAPFMQGNSGGGSIGGGVGGYGGGGYSGDDDGGGHSGSGYGNRWNGGGGGGRGGGRKGGRGGGVGDGRSYCYKCRESNHFVRDCTKSGGVGANGEVFMSVVTLIIFPDISRTAKVRLIEIPPYLFSCYSPAFF